MSRIKNAFSRVESCDDPRDLSMPSRAKAWDSRRPDDAPAEWRATVEFLQERFTRNLVEPQACVPDDTVAQATLPEEQSKSVASHEQAAVQLSFKKVLCAKIRCAFDSLPVALSVGLSVGFCVAVLLQPRKPGVSKHVFGSCAAVGSLQAAFGNAVSTFVRGF